MHQKRRYGGTGTRVVSGLLMFVLALTAIGGSFGVESSSAQEIQTRAVILHAATDLGKVEVAFNDDEVADEFEYGDQTDWIDLDPGTVQVWITRDRAGFNDTVFNGVYAVPAGNDYYLIITDELVIGGVFDQSPLAEGTARVGVTHASLDAPAVNVVATGEEADLATQLRFARSSEKVEIPAGEYSAEVRLAGTGDVLATATGSSESGMVYQHVIIGSPGDEDKPLEIVTLATTARAGRV